MPQFMLSVFHDDDVQAEGAAYADEAAMQDAFQKVAAFNDELQATNRLVFVGALLNPEDAVVVRATEEEPLSEEGPAHPGAQLGGFWIVTAEHIDEARVLGAQASAACGQPIEIRQLEG